MRGLFVIFFFTLSCYASAQYKGWGNTPVEDSDSSEVINYKAKESIAIYSGIVLAGDVGGEVRISTFLGKGRVKLGFNMCYTYSHFSDSAKKNNQEDIIDTPFGAMGFGLTSRIYTNNNVVHLTTSANYMISMNDSRFKTTNGINLKIAIGGALNKYSYVQAGFMAQTFLTTTGERPTNFGVSIGFGITL